MDKKKALVIAAFVIMIAAIIVLVAVIVKQKQAKPAAAPVATSTAAVAEATSTDQYRTEVPSGTQVPQAGQQLSEAEKKVVAVPTVQTAAAPGVSAQYRSFDIKAENGQFQPSKVIANSGDTVHINFTAVDKDYDLTFPSYGMQQKAKKGETKIIEFQAGESGDFLYYCQACGGADSSAVGHIIIAK